MFLRGLVAAIAAACIGLGTAGTATAAPPDCAGRGVPVSKISIQLWTFAEYIGFGTDAATIARTEEVFRRLQRDGLPQRRAVHAERPDRRASTARCWTSTG